MNNLDLFAPGASSAQRLAGLQAAADVFAAHGMLPEVAASAFARTQLDATGDMPPPSPAEVRACAIWRMASRAALEKCYADAAAPPVFMLICREE